MNRFSKYLVLLSLIAYGCDDGKIDETNGGEVAAGETPAGETPAGETPAGETPAGEMPAGEMPAGEIPAGEVPAGEIPAGEMPAGEMPTTQCNDEEDNDNDGAIDLADPGCADVNDDDESDDPAPTSCYDRDLINLNAALETNDYVDYDLATFGMSQTQGSCGGNAGPEATFKYEVTRPLSRLIFTTDFPETVNPVVLYVRDSCEGVDDMLGADFDCARGLPDTPGTSVEITDVTPGIYYIYVDTSSASIGPGPFRLSVISEGAPQCRDEVDNDGDDLIDLFDPGCNSPDDADEADPDPLPECGDGIDNDGDQLTDYPADPECNAAGANREARLCQNDYSDIFELDDEGGSITVTFDEMMTESFTDGCRANSGPESIVLLTLTEPSNVEVTFADPDAPFSAYIRSTCDDVTSTIACNEDFGSPLRALNLEPGEYFIFIDAHQADEAVLPIDFPFIDVNVTSLVTECNDGIDNDGDMLIDLADLGCRRGNDNSEADPALTPICADGIDNDEDGQTDYPADQSCVAAGSRYEADACENIQAHATLGMDGGIVSIDTTNLESNYNNASCGGSDTGGEQMIELQLDAPAQVDILLTNNDFDAVLFMRSDCEATEARSSCSDGFGDESLSYLRLERGRYMIFVDGFAQASGTGELSVTVNPLEQLACDDEIDNDGDNLVDALDPGCANAFDGDEADEATTPACSDTIDNDEDGQIDYPNDSGCFAAGSASENPVCNVPTPLYAIGQAGGMVTHSFIDGGNFFSNSCGQGEGLEAVIELTVDELSDIDLSITSASGLSLGSDVLLSLYNACDSTQSELACLNASSTRLPLVEAGTYYLVVERADGVELPTESWNMNFRFTSRIGECNDEEDNDSDGLLDLNDPGCTQQFDQSEADPDQVPQCFDGEDNDADGQTDYPADPDCVAAGDDVEQRRCINNDAIEVSMAGGVYSFDPVINEDHLISGCAFSSGAEAVYAITIEELSTINVSVTDLDGDFASVYTSLRRRCDLENSEIACVSTSADERSFENVQPGVYFLIVERTSGADPLPFTTTISVDVYTPAVCGDGLDNDEDGLIDQLDPGCSSPSDDDEADITLEVPVCSDGLDNDEDGQTDYPSDDFCISASGASEAPFCAAYTGELQVVTETTSFAFDTSSPEASSAYQNGSSAGSPEIPFVLVLTEPSAVSLEIANPSEGYDAYLHVRSNSCDDGETYIFNDDSDDSGEDLGTDMATNSPYIELDQMEPGIYYVFMDGYGTTNSGSATMIVTINAQETGDIACADGMDNDNDGLTDAEDPSCEVVESECSDGVDNDTDGQTDYPADPGCTDRFDDNEIDPNLIQPQCIDGVDNDEDGQTDYPADDFCLSAGAVSESAFCAAYNEPIQVVTASTSFEFDTSVDTASSAYANGSSATSPEIPVALVITQPSAVSLEIANPSSGYDAYLHVRANDCDFGETIAFNDDSNGTDGIFNSPYLEIEQLDPGVYYVFMDGFSSSNSGSATMNIGISPIIPPESQCTDGLDNDEDGMIDLMDDGCESPADLIEDNAVAATNCSNGTDTDGDGFFGYPDDPDCLGAGDTTDATYCTALPTQEIELDQEMNGSLVVNPLIVAPFLTTASCGADIGQPTAITFTVPELSDVFVTLNAEGSETTESTGSYILSVRPDCDDEFSENFCTNGVGSNEQTQVAELLPAGQYILMVEHGGVSNSGAITVDMQMVSRVTECNDEVDNDQDGFIDLLDSGCTTGDSPSETYEGPAPVCADSLDNDEDGQIDYPNDPNCTGAGDQYEVLLCENVEPFIVTGTGGRVRFVPDGSTGDVNSCSSSTSGEAVVAIHVEETSTIGAIVVDDNGAYLGTTRALRSTCDDVDTELQCLRSFFDDDVFVVTNVEPGWYFFRAHRSSSDPFNIEIFVVSENAPSYACSDMVDNDEDSFVDSDDPGCSTARDQDETDPDELAECADGIDNDQDGFIDLNDTDCQAAGDGTEATRCVALDSVDLSFTDSTGSIVIDPDQFVDSEDLGSCEGATAHGTATVVSFEVPALSDAQITLNGSSFDRYAYLRSATCEDEAEESNQVICNLQRNGSTETASLLPAGRYYLHVKRVNALDVAPIEVNVTLVARECADELDNDLDGMIDLEDMGCIDALDSTEDSDLDPEFVIPVCADGEDNDGDGLVDYPEDPQCEAAGDIYERETCEIYDSLATFTAPGGSYNFAPEENYTGTEVGCGFSAGQEAVLTLEITSVSNVTVTLTDDDGSEASVYMSLRTRCDDVNSEIECYSAFTSDERVFNNLEPGMYFLVAHRSEFSVEEPFTVDVVINPIECADGIDNDSDGLIDADDLGCESLRDLTEDSDADPEFVTPECADMIDNDEDGQIDYPNDPECTTIGDRFEMPSCENYDIASVVTSEGGSFEFSPEVDYSGTEVGCGFSAGQEAVYPIYVDELSRITVSVTDAPDDFSSVYMALRSDCDVEDSEVACFTSSSPAPRVFNSIQPGLYFLIVHRTAGAVENPFTVDIALETIECGDGVDNDGDNSIDLEDIGCESSNDLSESTDAEPDFALPECSDGIDNDMDGDIDYPNEDFCVAAGGTSESPSCELYNEPLQIVTETTNFMVTTSGANNYTRGSSANGPEVPFVIILEQESEVTITYDSDFDTYLHMRAGLCDGVDTYAYNDDSIGLNSSLTETLPAGIYFVFVDGFGESSAGAVTVSVTIQ